jgi:hypothetical protein
LAFTSWRIEKAAFSFESPTRVADPQWMKLGGYIQSTSATNTVNRFIKIAAAVPWKSGKRSLFSIFSMASSGISWLRLKMPVALGA